MVKKGYTPPTFEGIEIPNLKISWMKMKLSGCMKYLDNEDLVFCLEFLEI